MHPSGIAIQADRRAGLGGVNRPPASTQGGKQGLAAVAGQGVVGGGLPGPDCHPPIIAHNYGEKVGS